MSVRSPIPLKDSIVTQLLIRSFSVYFIITFLVTLVHMAVDYEESKKTLIHDLQTFENIVLPGLGEAIWNVNDHAVHAVLLGLMAHPAVIGAQVFDAKEQELMAMGLIPQTQAGELSTRIAEGNAASMRKNPQNQEILRQVLAKKRSFGTVFMVKAPFFTANDPAPLGHLVIYSDSQAVFQRVKTGFFMILINSVIKTLALWVIFIFFSRRMLSVPLAILTEATAKMEIENQEPPQVNIRAKRRHELKLLESTFNQMSQKLFYEIDHIQRLKHAFQKFVPQEFLQHLNKASLLDVRLGDNVGRNMTIMFVDLRNFTTISEAMSPNDNFRFINAFFGRMGPVIRRHQGFVDKYIGDAIMALFDGPPDEAVFAAIEMLQELREYNRTRSRPGREAIRMGIGIHFGPVMLGTVGEADRMDTTVISDVVNLASRLESLTKTYEVPLLMSGSLLQTLRNPAQFEVRFLDRVKPKGKKEPVAVFEVFDGDAPEMLEAKKALRRPFEEGVSLYSLHQFSEAVPLFEKCLAYAPFDRPTQRYLQRCRYYLQVGWSENDELLGNWD